MILYAISGLGADKRVFSRLNLNAEVVTVEWIEPRRNESLEAYSKRLSETIDVSKEFGLMGVSFGGMVAVEMSKILHPKVTILISSAETKNELRSIYRLLGKTRFLRLPPASWFSPPKTLIKLVFGAKNSKLLYQILKDTDSKFVKWSVNAMLGWKNTQTLEQTIKIHGQKDVMIPPSKDKKNILIKNGHHFMIVDKAKEISAVINKALKDV